VDKNVFPQYEMQSLSYQEMILNTVGAVSH
jgi:hypothetical protein